MKPLILSSLLGISLLIFQGCKGSKEDPVAVEPGLETYFDAAYLASNGYEDFAKTKATSDGKPVRVIKDLVGTKDLIWRAAVGVNGAEIPGPMWPTPPVYSNDETGGYILVQNILPNQWLSDDFAAIPQPFDVYVVMRDLQGVKYEGYFVIGYGMRNRGDHVEIKMDANDGSGLDNSTQMSAPTLPEENKRTIVRLRVDGANSKLWFNGVQVGPSSVDLKKGSLLRMGYGTNSHAAQHDFFGMWVKFGTLSEADHKVIYDKLVEVYKPGTYPDKVPIANKIKPVWNSTTKAWTATYEYFSPTGAAEDKTKTEYQWGYHTKNQELNTSSFFIGAKAKNSTLIRSDFPIEIVGPGTSKVEIFVSVKVYDVAGNSWSHFLRSDMVQDDLN